MTGRVRGHSWTELRFFEKCWTTARWHFGFALSQIRVALKMNMSLLKNECIFYDIFTKSGKFICGWSINLMA